MRGAIAVETLLKVILILAVIILALRLIREAVGAVSTLLEPVPELLTLVILILIVLWLLDRL